MNHVDACELFATPYVILCVFVLGRQVPVDLPKSCELRSDLWMVGRLLFLVSVVASAPMQLEAHHRVQDAKGRS